MDEDTVRKWIRLKRYEQPEPEYFDAFLREFHRRQRQELLRRSSLSLFVERLNTYLSDPRSQGWAYAPVVALFVVALYVIVGMTDDSPLPEMPALAQIQPTADLRYLEKSDISLINWRGPVTLLDTEHGLIPESTVEATVPTQTLVPASAPPFGEEIRLKLPENEGVFTPPSNALAIPY